MSLVNSPIDRATFLKRAGGLFALALIDQPALRQALSAREHGGHHLADPLPHPEPRPGITGEKVLSGADLGESPKKDVIATYDVARENAQLFDSLACGCGCSEKNGEHRSLLVCFETKQATGCGSCREQAKFVVKLATEGKSLAEIRAAVDKKFG
jgi:hypothetical protein